MEIRNSDLPAALRLDPRLFRPIHRSDVPNHRPRVYVERPTTLPPDRRKRHYPGIRQCPNRAALQHFRPTPNLDLLRRWSDPDEYLASAGNITQELTRISCVQWLGGCY